MRSVPIRRRSDGLKLEIPKLLTAFCVERLTVYIALNLIARDSAIFSFHCRSWLTQMLFQCSSYSRSDHRLAARTNELMAALLSPFAFCTWAYLLRDMHCVALLGRDAAEFGEAVGFFLTQSEFQIFYWTTSQTCERHIVVEVGISSMM